MYKLHLPEGMNLNDLEKNYELEAIEALEAEMDREVDRQMQRAYNRRLNRMYEDMWTNGATGLR